MTTLSDHELRPLVVAALWEASRQGEIAATRFGVANSFLQARQQVADAVEKTIDWGFPELHQHWQERVCEILWDLAVERLIRPHLSHFSNSPNLDRMEVTDFGRQVLAEPNNPFDPDGTLTRLRQAVPNIDPVIVAYFAESMNGLRNNCLLSSTITLGCASEKAMLLLFGRVHDGLSSADQSRFDDKVRKKRFIKSKADEFWKLFSASAFRKNLEKQDALFLGSLENVLLSVFNHLREMRNDAGHPTGISVVREDAAARLMVFPHYVKTVYKFTKWVDAAKPLSL